MFYIFNSSNVCIGTCNFEPDKEDLKSRGEFFVQSDNYHNLGSIYSDNQINEVIVPVDYTAKARGLRDSLRDSIDKFLLPSSTIEDVLVTEDQKNTLIQDSLLLAKWPTQEGWPYIALPELSDLCKSIMVIPEWSHPTQTAT